MLIYNYICLLLVTSLVVPLTFECMGNNQLIEMLVKLSIKDFFNKNSSYKVLNLLYTCQSSFLSLPLSFSLSNVSLSVCGLNLFNARLWPINKTINMLTARQSPRPNGQSTSQWSPFINWHIIKIYEWPKQRRDMSYIH